MPHDDAQTQRVLTLPNLLTLSRLAGTVVLLGLAWAGEARLFPWVLVPVIATDFLDGSLAKLLNQRTALGARLDSLADTALGIGLVFCTIWLRPEVIQREFVLLSLVAGTFAVGVGLSFARFGRPPAYHTLVAKTSWLLVTIAAVFLFTGGTLVPLRIALFVVLAGNVEAIVITSILPEWRPNVLSIWHARRVG